MADRISRFVSDLGLAVSLVRCTAVGSLIGAQQHGLRSRPLRTVVEAIASALLLGTRMKGRGLLTWTYDGHGVLDRLRVDAIGLGEVRALVPERVSAACAQWNGVDALLGPGQLTVGRQLVQEEQPYMSVVAIDTAEGESMAGIGNAFLRRSEQVSARLLLDVRTDGDAVVLAHGCYLEALPGCERAALPAAARDWLQADCPTGVDLAEPDDRRLIAAVTGTTCKFLREYPVLFTCPCSRERYIGTLRGFAKEQLRGLTNGEGLIVTTCDFCKAEYRIPLDEVI